MSQHTYNLILSGIAIVAITAIGIARPQVSPELVIGAIVALAGGVSVGTAAVNGWKRRREETQSTKQNKKEAE